MSQYTLKPKPGGAVTVSTAGTAVKLTSTDARCASVTIQAARANTGRIYVGDSTVAAANGIDLGPGDSVKYEAPIVGEGGQAEYVLSDFYIDASVNGDKATFHYEVQR